MFCTHCGAANQVMARFCINCAQPIKEVQIERKLSRPSARKVDTLQVLLDFSFNRLVSARMIKSLYALSVLFGGLSAFFLIVAGFKTSVWLGTFALLVGGPLIFLLVVLYSRILLETILVLFRIAENTANLSVTNIGFSTTENKSESRDGIQWKI